MDRKLTVLYIEDDKTNQILVRKLLSSKGYEVLLAEDGLSGIDMASESQPAIILIDMNMPGLDGYETTTRLRSMDHLSKVPIIALTANVLKGDRERSLIAGCDGYITKPINLYTFNEEIKRYLSGQREVVPGAEESQLLREYSGKLVSRLEKKVRNLSSLNTELEQRFVTKVSEVESIQQQLLQSEKLASIGQLAAGVAHEINNPIGFINSNINSLQRYVTGMLELLVAYAPLDTEIKDEATLAKINQIKDSIDFDYLKTDIKDLLSESLDGVGRVKKIIQDLKDFSRVDSAEFEWSDLHQGLDSTLNMVQNEIKYKAEVIKEYGELPEVECVGAQINQVFMNLLVNAAHAINEHGTITIRTSTCDNDKVQIEISDTGNGISKEHLNKIFDPFFTTKPVGKGTGLGLSLSYGIINEHGGTINARSEVGKGTTFMIQLPIQKPAVLIDDESKNN
ncbi:MAG: two-component system NtrC family sensor kinase [Enterobacterales bacterium]|jgi:two-component system NtrC family sensor kinase